MGIPLYKVADDHYVVFIPPYLPDEPDRVSEDEAYYLALCVIDTVSEYKNRDKQMQTSYKHIEWEYDPPLVNTEEELAEYERWRIDTYA